MATVERSLRNLTADITSAQEQVKRARQDGKCDAIKYWVRRRDELLDRLSERLHT